MGEIRKKFTVKKNFEASESVQVDFLLDSGATYSLIPAVVLEMLSIHPHSEVDIVLADGSKLKRPVGDAYFEYQGERGSAPVIFGAPGEEPLLGAITLEALRLTLHPFKREIYPSKDIRL